MVLQQVDHLQMVNSAGGRGLTGSGSGCVQTKMAAVPLKDQRIVPRPLRPLLRLVVAQCVLSVSADEGLVVTPAVFVSADAHRLHHVSGLAWIDAHTLVTTSHDASIKQWTVTY